MELVAAEVVLLGSVLGFFAPLSICGPEFALTLFFSTGFDFAEAVVDSEVCSAPETVLLSGAGIEFGCHAASVTPRDVLGLLLR